MVFKLLWSAIILCKYYTTPSSLEFSVDNETLLNAFKIIFNYTFTNYETTATQNHITLNKCYSL